MLCRVLGVSRAGYSAWRDREPSQRQQDNDRLLHKIKAVDSGAKGRYGAPRIHAELRDQGERVGRQRVARLMRQAGLRGKGKRKDKVTTTSEHDHPVAENVLARHVQVGAPTEVWVGDLTDLPTHEGWLHLAVLIDLFSRRVVGWAMGERLTTALALSALDMAAQARRPPPGLLCHTDRGSQYASRAYRQALSA